MGVQSIEVATLAAIVATAISVTCTWPQLIRIRRTGDIAGVSITAAALTVSSEIAWTVYLGGQALWSAVPEGVSNIGANTLVFVAVARFGGASRIALVAAASWLGLLLATRSVGGAAALAAVLGAAYALQLTPAVVTAWRTWSPSGIAAPTWTLRLLESVLWGGYGYLHGDPPLIAFGILGSVASAAILLRKYLTRHRPSVRNAAVPTSQLLDNAVVG